MSYGEFNNLDLCTNYGFTLSRNPLDVMEESPQTVGDRFLGRDLDRLVCLLPSLCMTDIFTSFHAQFDMYACI